MTNLDRKQNRGGKTYFTGKPCGYGHMAERRVASRRCVVCDNATSRRYYAENLGKARAHKVKIYRSVEANRANHMLTTSRSSAKRRGIEHTITVADIHFGTNCPCCNVAFDLKVYREKGRSCTSIDRLDNSKGYVTGNVNVICWRCNWVKGNSTLSELKAVVAWIEGHHSHLF